MEARTTFNSKEPYVSIFHVREILALALPATLAIASEPILSLADTAMIGRIGVEPLAARAIASALIGGIYWIFIFLVFGTTTIVGYHHGANQAEACGATYLHALFLATFGGITITLLGILFAPDLYRLMGAEERVLTQGVIYFRIRIAGAPFTFLFYATVGFLRGIQNTKIPMIIAFLVNGLNLILDWLLIYGKLGLPAMGLRGAAWAALTSQLIGAGACIGILLFSPTTAAYRPRSWGISLGKFLPLFRIGRDLAIRTGSLRFSLVFATGSVARMGANALSSHEIAFQLFLLCSDVIDGLAVAGQALVAKYLGADRADQAYRMGRTLILCGCFAGLLFAVGFLGAQGILIRLFTQSPEVVLILSGGLFLLLALFQPLNGIVFVLDGFLIGAYDTRFLMWAMILGALGICVPISWLSLQLDLGLLGVWVGLSLLMIFRLGTNLHRFLSMRWRHASSRGS